MDEEIQKTIEAVLGKDIEIVDSQQTRSVQEEEILLINGHLVKLEGSDAASIKIALKTGKIPSCDLLNQILLNAGIINHPVRLETSLTVKSSLTSTEEIRVVKNGHPLEDRVLETKEDNIYESSCSEVWEPILNNPSSLRNANSLVDTDLKYDYVKRNKTTENKQRSPIRQNSVCTNDSISSVSTSSRPTSDLSLNINYSDMNLYDNIQSYLLNQQGNSTGTVTKDSCDSGHDFGSPSNDYERSDKNSSKFSLPSSQSFTTEKTTDSFDEVDFKKISLESNVMLKPQTTLVIFKQ